MEMRLPWWWYAKETIRVGSGDISARGFDGRERGGGRRDFPSMEKDNIPKIESKVLPVNYCWRWPCMPASATVLSFVLAHPRPSDHINTTWSLHHRRLISSILHLCSFCFFGPDLQVKAPSSPFLYLFFSLIFTPFFIIFNNCGRKIKGMVWSSYSNFWT